MYKSHENLSLFYHLRESHLTVQCHCVLILIIVLQSNLAIQQIRLTIFLKCLLFLSCLLN
jgi:hypothetical protein